MAGSISTTIFTEAYPTTGGKNVNSAILEPGTNGTWTNFVSGTPGSTPDGAMEDAGYMKIQMGVNGAKFRIPLLLDS